MLDRGGAPPLRATVAQPPLTPIPGAGAWRGEEMARSTRWVRTLDRPALAEIDVALRAARSQGRAWHATTRESFPLETLADTLAEIGRELEDGCGVVDPRGLPVERYPHDALRHIRFGLGSHLGRPVFQNRPGELVREIRDEGRGVGERYGQIPAPDGGKSAVLSSYARTLSNGALRFHTDRCDVVGLLCVRHVRTDRTSKLCSSVAVHNEMIRRRPDLAEALYPDVCRCRTAGRFRRARRRCGAASSRAPCAPGSSRPPRREPPGRPRGYFLAVSPNRVSSTSRTSLTASRHRLLSGAVS